VPFIISRKYPGLKVFNTFFSNHIDSCTHYKLIGVVLRMI
ncbi:MAG: hypothetical protein ACI85Q_000873, partial [Salibacteraceae bacterium]